MVHRKIAVALLLLACAGVGFAQNVTVYITRTGEKYHVGGCRYLRESSIPISLSEAVAKGYTPCSVCNPPVLGGRPHGQPQQPMWQAQPRTVQPLTSRQQIGAALAPLPPKPIPIIVPKVPISRWWVREDYPVRVDKRGYYHDINCPRLQWEHYYKIPLIEALRKRFIPCELCKPPLSRRL